MLVAQIQDFLYGDRNYYRREWKRVMEELRQVQFVKDFIRQLEIAVEVEMWLEEEED